MCRIIALCGSTNNHPKAPILIERLDEFYLSDADPSNIKTGRLDTVDE